jgi:DNA processing protein
MADLGPDEKRAWLRLIRTENVGPVTFYRLLQRFGTAARALEALPHLAKAGGKTSFSAASRDSAEREIAAAEKAGARIVTRAEAAYPPLLAEIDDAPPVITVLGDAAIAARPALGIVGARNASLAGRKLAEDYARRIGSNGYAIVSGLARGIDTAAHAAALDSGTVAVVAGGIDVVYPPENRDLYRRIAEQGCIFAESPFGTEPLARHFPRRNRIIAGLSLGVLIVEAAAKSGSLITARMAMEQNREVFAVPGSPLDPRAEGCNLLIRDGAQIVTGLGDVLHGLDGLKNRGLREDGGGWQGSDGSDMAAPGMGAGWDDQALRDKILENLSRTPIDQNELIRALDAPISSILTILLALELAGRIERQAGNKLNLI